MDKETVRKMNTHAVKEESKQRTGTADSIAEAKKRSNDERKVSGSKQIIEKRTVITSENGTELDRKTVDEVNDSSRQKQEPVERTRLLHAEKRKAKSGELIIKEIKNPDGTITKILSPEGEE